MGLVETGLLEMFYEKKWRPYCPQDWKEAKLKVACKDIGYMSFDSYNLSVPDSGSVNAVWLKNLTCSGNEPKLLSCSYDEPRSGDCKKEVWLSCEAHGKEEDEHGIV